jgi:hypothetical protein
MYKNTIEIIIGGDFNINYFNKSLNKQLLDSLLSLHGLCSIVLFPTRIQNNSCSLIDNIFINKLKFNKFSVYPIINGLSDHDAQGPLLHNIFEEKRNEYNNYFFITGK